MRGRGGKDKEGLKPHLPTIERTNSAEGKQSHIPKSPKSFHSTSAQIKNYHSSCFYPARPCILNNLLNKALEFFDQRREK